MKLRWGVLGIGAACAACCAPLLLPWLAGAGIAGAGALGGGLVLGLTPEQGLCVGIPLAVLGAVLLIWLRRLSRPRAKPCGCQAACEIESCAPPDQQPPRT
jgi:hypothetical protein